MGTVSHFITLSICILTLLGCTVTTPKQGQEDHVNVPLSLVVQKTKESPEYIYKSHKTMNNELKALLGISDGTYVIYKIDMSCSVCIYDYICFSRFMTSPYACICDSVITLAYGEDNFTVMEYYLERDKVERIKKESIVIDDDKLTMVKSLESFAGDNNFIVVDDNQLVFACHTRALKNDSTGNFLVPIIYKQNKTIR